MHDCHDLGKRIKRFWSSAKRLYDRVRLRKAKANETKWPPALQPETKQPETKFPQAPERPKVPPSTRVLPVDVFDRVADFLFEIRPPGDHHSSIICCTKPHWKDVEGFLKASPELHAIGFVRWLVVLTIRIPEDWDRAKQYAHRVRELHCLDRVFDSPSHRRVLIHFKHLYAVSIDAHSDVSHNDQNQFKYRNLIKALPPSLRRLEITRAHGPDIRVIATVKGYCPNLEELRLGRCTIFNSPVACDFWRSFPFDHDSYMSNQDTDGYAHSLAQELFPLRSLVSLRLGLYLIPSTTILAHRIYHRRNLEAPAGLQWQQALPLLQPPAAAAAEPPAMNHLLTLLHEPDPEREFGSEHVCTMCTGAVGETSQNAEASANTIIKGLVPSLGTIQWMNWLTPGHLGFSSYTTPHSS